MENSNTPWTPGPWAFDTSPDDGWIVGDVSNWVPGIAKIPAYKDMPNDANARLIAAAPEMAAFIQKYVDAWRSGTGTVYLIDEAQAILASIEGKS